MNTFRSLIQNFLVNNRQDIVGSKLHISSYVQTRRHWVANGFCSIFVSESLALNFSFIKWYICPVCTTNENTAHIYPCLGMTYSLTSSFGSAMYIVNNFYSKLKITILIVVLTYQFWYKELKCVLNSVLTKTSECKTINNLNFTKLYF